MPNLRDDYEEVHEHADHEITKLQARWNVTALSPHFAVGGEIVSKAMVEDLEKFGITHVICVAEEVEEQTVKLVDKTDMELFLACLAEGDTSDQYDALDLVAIVRWMQKQIGQSVTRSCLLPRFYIHCHEGKHRGPVALAVAVAFLSWTEFDDARRLIEALRPVVQFKKYPALLQAGYDAVCILRGEMEDGDGDHDGDGGPVGDPDHDADEQAKAQAKRNASRIIRPRGASSMRQPA